MGFLDDLKRQADALKNQQTVDAATLARNAALADAACKTIQQYWMELMPQLNVLRPTPPLRFSLDSRTPLDGLVRQDFRVDARRKQHRGQDACEHVVIHGVQKSGRTLTMSKDFPPEIERLEARLRQAGITPDVQVKRDQSNGRLLETRFSFVADLVLMVRAVPDHDAGRIRFQLNNIDGFETLTAEFPAHHVNSALLDELARWLTGSPHQFLKQAENIKRVEF
jgi:hypothetical protein